MTNDALICGSASVDVTPQADLILAGKIFTAGFWYERFLPMTSVRDPLSARACYLARGETEIALVSWESLGDVEGMTRRVAKLLLVSGETGMRLILTCTHSHTVPDTIALCGRRQPEAYLRLVAERIAGAVLEAKRKAVAVSSVQSATARVSSLALNRRPVLRNGLLAVLETAPAPETIADPGVLDDSLTSIRILDTSGCAIARIVHWACHPVSMQASPTVSPGYSGLLSAMLEREGQATSIFLNGACGDVNPVRMGRWEDANELAECLAGIVRNADRKSKPVWTEDAGSPICIEESVRTSRRETRVAKRVAEEETSHDSSSSNSDAEKRHSGKGWREFLEQQVSRVAGMPETLEVPVIGFRVGKLIIAGVGGEIFSEYGLDLRRTCPDHMVLPVSCVNSYFGYIAPERAYDLGGYETQCAPWCPLARGESERIMAATRLIMTRLGRHER